MSWQSLQKQAKKTFPNLKPARASGFTSTEDGQALIVSLYDIPVMLVVGTDIDLCRLKATIDIVLRARSKK